MKIYHHPRCSTCKQVIKEFKNNNKEFELIDLTETSLSYDELKDIHEVSALEIKKFFNTSGMKYRELGLKDKLPTMSLDECYKLLSSDGMLVKRPLITDGKTITLGKKDSINWL